MSAIQQIVSTYRRKRNLPLRDFAAAIGVSHQSVANWEAGAHTPHPGVLLPLALRCGDWRREFAFDCLAAIQPEVYAPAGEIGVAILGQWLPAAPLEMVPMNEERSVERQP